MQNSRKRSVGQLGVGGVLILMVMGGTVQAKDARVRTRNMGDGPALKVGIYNYAHIGGLELRHAEDEAGRLFSRAGVRIVWVDCALEEREVSSHPECSSRDAVLRILPASMSDPLDPRAEALGSAMSGPESARIAWVFPRRVASLASSWQLDSGLVLGEAAAHELGHLLLGPGHERHGIMQANWTPQDLRLASRGEVHFSEAQAAFLREAVKGLHVDPTSPLAARR